MKTNLVFWIVVPQKSVGGEGWLNDSIGFDKNELKKEETSERFKFGPGNPWDSYKCRVPVKIEDIEGNEIKEDLQMHIVKADIPLLIGADELERQDAELKFRNKTVTLNGRKFKMRRSQGGHFLVDFKADNTTYVAEVSQGRNKNKGKSEGDVKHNLYKDIKNLHTVTGHKGVKDMSGV